MGQGGKRWVIRSQGLTTPQPQVQAVVASEAIPVAQDALPFRFLPGNGRFLGHYLIRQHKALLEALEAKEWYRCNVRLITGLSSLIGPMACRISIFEACQLLV